MVNIKNFGETLRDMLTRKKCIQADLERLLGLQKSKMHRILYDEMSASNIGGISALAKISDFLKLTAPEHEDLFESYYCSVSGKSYEIYKKIIGIMNEKFIPEFSADDETEKNISNGTPVSSPVLSVLIKNIISSAEKNICILYTPRENGIFFDALKELEKTSAKQISMLTYLDPNEISGDENLAVSMRTYFLQSRINADIRYEYADISHAENFTPFPYFILSENRLLLISEDSQNGVYFNSPNIISNYKMYFERKFSSARILIYKLEDLKIIMDFIMHDTEDVSKNPVIILNDFPPAVLSGDKEHFTKFARDGALPEEFAETLYQWYISVTSASSEIISVCSQTGVADYLDAEEFYEYSSEFVHSQPKDIRRALFGNMLESASAGEMHISLTEKMMFENVDISIINVLPSGISLIYSKTGRLFIIREKSIGNGIRSIVEMMQKCELIKFGDTALNILTEAYGKRKNNIRQ